MNRPHRQAAAAAPEAPPLTAQIFQAAVQRHQASDLAVAEPLYRAALALQPADSQAAYNLGLLLQTQQRLPEAVAAYRHAIAARPDFSDACCNLGVALGDSGTHEEAVAAYRQALALRPDFAMAHCNLGVTLKALGQPEAAIAAYHRAIALQPEYGFAYANLAAVLLDEGRLEEALTACERALAFQPELALAHFNLGTALRHMGQVEAAIAAFRRATALAPALAEAHFSLGQTLLLHGDFSAGWPEYEWRWKLRDYAWLENIHGAFAQPRWTGEALRGRTLLIYAEQGLGDAIQYVRYLPRVAAAGGPVILAVHPPLMRLFAGLPEVASGAVTLVRLDAVPLPAFDLHCPLLSLPLVSSTTLATVPIAVPYLAAEAPAVAHWRTRLDGATRPGERRVGIVWAGNPTQGGDRFRSPRLAAMRPLFDVPGIRFVALQVGPGRADISAQGLPDNVLDLGAEIADLADTAAIMQGLDLVVTSCTAPLHLAGALGVPVWGVIPASPHFAWLQHGADSAWYPSLRLYRQARHGTDWHDVVARVAADLAAL